jgi:signal transduction histidine kinase
VIRRLLFTYLTFALLILVVLEVPLGYVQHRNEQQHAFEQLEHDAEVLAAFVDTALNSGDVAQVDILAHESAQRLGGYIDIVDAAGTLMSSTHEEQHPPRSLAAAADIRSVLDGQGRVSTRTAVSAGVDVMSVAVPIHPGVTAQGAIRVTVATAALTARIEHFWLLLVAAGIIVLVVAAVTAVALARWISRPVRALEQATRQVADGTPPPPLSTTTGPPELRHLAVTFSAMAHRLQGLIASQRAFIGHASHQLKTPLAALRLRLENLEPDIADAGGRNLRAALAETDRLARLVDTLLAMARAEQATRPAVPIDLAAAVADRILLWEALAAVQNVRLSATGAGEGRVLAAPGTVDQIIDNLLSNALRAAPRGSTVTLTWRAASPAAGPPMAELHVIDKGPGLSPEHCLKALEPFWRAPGAPAGGTGLGLALVRELAGAGGGGVALRPGDGAGIDAVVTLPAAPVAITI